MPLCTLRLDGRFGPVIELAVLQDHLTRRLMLVNRLEPPNSISARFLIDTGAAMTKIEGSILRGLGLSPVSTIAEVTASSGATPIDREVYCVELIMPGARDPFLAWDLQVTSAEDLSGFGVQGLLGRDILERCHLFYNGPEGHLSLAIATPPYPDDD
jgi:predicted aspartyl protease